MREEQYSTEQYLDEAEESRQSITDMLPEDKIQYSTEIDAKLLTSGYNKTKFLVKKPIWEQKEFGIPYLDKNGNPKMVNGKPVLKAIKTLNYIIGIKESVFPLPVNLHNDSVVSGILDDKEIEEVQELDGMIYDLSLDMYNDPNTDYSTSIQYFAGVKASIVESSKAKGGRMAELSKTNISKADQRSWEYSQRSEFDEFNKRQGKRGLFGLGIGPF